MHVASQVQHVFVLQLRYWRRDGYVLALVSSCIFFGVLLPGAGSLRCSRACELHSSHTSFSIPWVHIWNCHHVSKRVPVVMDPPTRKTLRCGGKDSHALYGHYLLSVVRSWRYKNGGQMHCAHVPPKDHDLAASHSSACLEQ